MAQSFAHLCGCQVRSYVIPDPITPEPDGSKSYGRYGQSDQFTTDDGVKVVAHWSFCDSHPGGINLNR